MRAMVELVLTQEPGDDSDQRFRLAPVSLGPEDGSVGWVLVDMTRWDGALGGCLFTTSKENAQHLRAAAARRGGLVPLLHSVLR
jgi:hypothetical protein